MSGEPIHRFLVTTEIFLKRGAFDTLGERARQLQGSRALVVTDAGVKATGLLQRAQELLGGAGLETIVIDSVESDPSIEVMDSAGRVFAENRCDLIVGIGGGSPMDVAKATAIVATGGGSIGDYVGTERVSMPPVPVIAVPTTAGTGSEVSWHISILDQARNLKVTVRSPWSMARVAILDPQLLSTLPARVAAATGMDALAHLVEGYTARWASPISDALALEGIRLIGENLRMFVANRANVDAAEKMIVASNLGGMVLSNAQTTLCHSMARALGAHFHLHHGLSTALLLPRVSSFNSMASPAKFANVATALGEDVSGMSPHEAASLAGPAIARLRRDIALPETLKEIGVTPSAVASMAKDAMDRRAEENNPRSVTVEEVMGLYSQDL